MRTRKWTLKCRDSSENQNPLSIDDFQILEEDISDIINEGEILCRAEWLSVDPYVRAGGLEGKPLFDTTLINSQDDSKNENVEKISHIPGPQIARVIKTMLPEEFPEGCLVYGFFGWRDLTLYKPGSERSWRTLYRLPDYMSQLPPSYALGPVGMPGVTAYYAVTKILQIDGKGGGTLVVSTATGAVGNMVLQLGKLLDCKTLVFTSTDAKVIWLKTLGAGFIFNYNKVDPQQVFEEFAPEGIDYYFDNVGGEFTYHVMKNMKNHGRIAVCDAISCYNQDGGGGDKIDTVPFDYLTVVDKRIRLEGFSVYEYPKEWELGMREMTQLIMDGKITVEETVLEGFEQMPQAFMDRYHAKVVGVQVVKA